MYPQSSNLKIRFVIVAAAFLRIRMNSSVSTTNLQKLAAGIH